MKELVNALEGYKTTVFPASRLATIDIGAAGLSRHRMGAFFELDVTRARQIIAAEDKKQCDRPPANRKEKTNFNAWLLKCISLAIAEHSLLHGMRSGKRKVIVFDDIDISVMIEREIDGEKAPLPYVVRRTNTKSVDEISEEIAAARRQMIAGESDYVLGDRKNRRLMKLYYTLPELIRKRIWIALLKKPFLVKRQMGTVMVTSVGMVGEIRGWVIPVSVHPICFVVGSIVKKPGIVGERIEARDYLHLTAVVDHDVIDGAPAVRALGRLKELVESAHGL